MEDEGGQELQLRETNVDGVQKWTRKPFNLDTRKFEVNSVFSKKNDKKMEEI